MAIADETLDRIEAEDLSGLGRADIDDVIEYVHVPTARLPEYRKLYDRYLRQRWNVNELDFTEDRVNWAERMTDDARNSFLSIASGFHHGERQVEVELAPLLFGASEDYKIFLTSQLEDEARHTVFFDRFYRDVVGLDGDGIMDVLDGSWPFIQETFVGPFGLLAYLTDDLRRDPYNKHLQMKYATTYFIWIEGVLALSVMKITLNYARDFRVLPAFYTGFTATCRDEARHVQAGHAVRAGPAGRGPGLREGPARHAADPADHERGPVELRLLRAARLVRGAGSGAVHEPAAPQAGHGRRVAPRGHGGHAVDGQADAGGGVTWPGS